MLPFVMGGLLFSCGQPLENVGQAMVTIKDQSLMFRPVLPDGLAAWRTKIVWQVSSSCWPDPADLSTWLIPSDEIKQTSSIMASPKGDWLRCRPFLITEDGTIEPCDLVELGWISGFDTRAPDKTVPGSSCDGRWLELDGAGGLAAIILARLDQAGADWTGLNLARLNDEIRRKNLDSETADVWRLYQAIASHDLSNRDLTPRLRYPLEIDTASSGWRDVHGVECSWMVDTTEGTGKIKVTLPLGTSTLFRADGGAYLRVNVHQAGDGSVRACWVEHCYP